MRVSGACDYGYDLEQSREISFLRYAATYTHWALWGKCGVQSLRVAVKQLIIACGAAGKASARIGIHYAKLCWIHKTNGNVHRRIWLKYGDRGKTI